MSNKMKSIEKKSIAIMQNLRLLDQLHFAIMILFNKPMNKSNCFVVFVLENSCQFQVSKLTVHRSVTLFVTVIGMHAGVDTPRSDTFSL